MVNGLLIFSDNTVIASCIALYAEFKRDWFPDTSNSVFIAQSSFINNKKAYAWALILSKSESYLK